MEIRIELFDAKKCAPVESGNYFTVTKNGAMNLTYSRKHNAWNVNDFSENTETEIFPLWWSPMPITGEKIAEMNGETVADD